MDVKPDKIVQRSKLFLRGQYVASLYRKISKTEQCLEDFYERAKKKIEETRDKLRKCESQIIIPDDVMRRLEILHSELDVSDDDRERDTIIKRLQSEMLRVENLPLLFRDKALEEFLKFDNCLIDIDCDLGENGEYESDFESDVDENACSRSPSPDQVGGRKKPMSDIVTEAGKNLYVPRSNEGGLEHLGGNNKSLEPEKDITKRKRSLRNKTLKVNTSFQFDMLEEKILPFSELKDHLPTIEIEESPLNQNVDYEVQESGDIELPACTDVKLFETYVVLTMGEKIMKLDIETKETIEELKLPYAGRMCAIRKSSCVGVIQTNSSITVIKTDPHLKVLYTIKTKKAYTDICHVETHVNTPRNVPDTSFTFGLVYTDISCDKGKRYDEKIDIVKAAATTTANKHRIPEYNSSVEAFHVKPFDISGISGIGVVWSGGKLKLILGCVGNIVCLEQSESKITKAWSIPIRKAATDVVCVKNLAYICVQDERRVVLVDKDGKVVCENVLEGLMECRPHRLSVFADTLLVKLFDESKWKSVVFAKQYKKQ